MSVETDLLGIRPFLQFNSEKTCYCDINGPFKQTGQTMFYAFVLSSIVVLLENSTEDWH